jgi:hypothetical protein
MAKLVTPTEQVLPPVVTFQVGLIAVDFVVYW